MGNYAHFQWAPKLITGIMNWTHKMNDICEIEANPASGYSTRELNVNGQMDGRMTHAIL